MGSPGTAARKKKPSRAATAVIDGKEDEARVTEKREGD